MTLTELSGVEPIAGPLLCWLQALHCWSFMGLVCWDILESRGKRKKQVYFFLQLAQSIFQIDSFFLLNTPIHFVYFFNNLIIFQTTTTRLYRYRERKKNSYIKNPKPTSCFSLLISMDPQIWCFHYLHELGLSLSRYILFLVLQLLLIVCLKEIVKIIG